MSIAGTPRTAVIAGADRVTAYAAAVRRISWGAIFAGMIIAMVVQLLLGLLGFGIGIASVNPETASAETGRGFAIGMTIWWIASSLIALFAGGWVAGRLAGFPRAGDGGLHGLVAWAAMTVLSLYLVTTAVGSIAGGALNVVGQGLQTTAQGVAQTAAQQAGQPGLVEDPAVGQLKQKAREAMQNPQSTMAQLDQTIETVFSKGPDGRIQINHDEAVTQLVQSGKMDRNQAEQTVTQWEQTLQQGQQKLAQAKENVKQTAAEARKPVAAAAIWAFVALCLGALAAGLGGRIGAPRMLPVAAAMNTGGTIAATTAAAPAPPVPQSSTTIITGPAPTTSHPTDSPST